MGKRAPRDPTLPVDKVLGARIRTLREAKGWTARDLASQLGLSYQQIQKYENGQNRISAHTLFEIANLLGTSVGPLFEGLPALASDTTATAQISVRVTRLLGRPHAMALLDRLLDLPDPAWTALERLLRASAPTPAPEDGVSGAPSTSAAGRVDQGTPKTSP